MQPLPELGRRVMVEFKPGIDQSLFMGTCLNFMHMPAVASVVDLAAISRETLDTFLLPDDRKIPRTRGKR